MTTRSILITGALGHIGSHLIRSISDCNDFFNVYLLDNFHTDRYCSLFDLPTNMTYKLIKADVRNIYKILLPEKIDVVVHLAAYTNPSISHKDPDNFMKHNIECTESIANFCVTNESKLIYVSSTSIYSKSANNIQEDCTNDYISGQTPYAKSKILEEEIVSRVPSSHKSESIILRFGTIYGKSPGMRFHTAVNKFCWEAAIGNTCKIWSTALNQRRPYLDIRDAVNAIIFSINEQKVNSGIYNVATDNVTVDDIIKTIAKYKPGIKVEYVDSPIMNNLSYSVSSEKLKNLGFTFKGSLDESISNILDQFNSIESI